jgi:hypothetical protein
MIKNFDEIKRQLSELAPAINSFKSEAVQLRVVELIFRGGAQDSEPDAADTDGETSSASSPRRGRRRKSVEPATANGEAKSRPKTVGRPGGLSMLGQLFNDGFFKKPHTIVDIIGHCRTNLAMQYKQPEFSGPLIRFVRDGKLKRVKNKDHQYEYTQA